MRNGNINSTIQGRKSLARTPIKTQPVAASVQAGSRIRKHVRLNRYKARVRRRRRGMRWGRTGQQNQYKQKNILNTGWSKYAGGPQTISLLVFHPAQQVRDSGATCSTQLRNGYAGRQISKFHGLVRLSTSTQRRRERCHECITCT